MITEEKNFMMEFQLKARGIDKQRILDVFEQIPREEFVPENLKDYSYADLALPIGRCATISQPYIVAFMTQTLNPKENDLILEIGTGSGYQSAILSKLCRKVVTLEIDEKLAKKAEKNIEKLKIENIEIIIADGTDFDYHEQFDRIIISAATPEIPQNLIRLLKDKGIILAPEGGISSQRLNKYQKIYGKLDLIETGIPVIFVPMQGKFGF